MSTLDVVLLGLNVLMAFIIALFARGFLPSYFGEKGKNLATKEDIEAITTKVEAIRAEYSRALQLQSHQDQRQRDHENRMHAMRLAAVDKRLEAHQQAYVLWRKLVASVHHSDRIGAVILECQAWWEKHCLYLDDEARQAFYDAYISAGAHGDLLQGDRTADAVRDARENWQHIIGAGQVIVRGAALPPLAQSEHTIAGLAQDSEGTA